MIKITNIQVETSTFDKIVIRDLKFKGTNVLPMDVEDLKALEIVAEDMLDDIAKAVDEKGFVPTKVLFRNNKKVYLELEVEIPTHIEDDLKDFSEKVEEAAKEIKAGSKGINKLKKILESDDPYDKLVNYLSRKRDVSEMNGLKKSVIKFNNLLFNLKDKFSDIRAEINDEEKTKSIINTIVRKVVQVVLGLIKFTFDLIGLTALFGIRVISNTFKEGVIYSKSVGKSFKSNIVDSIR